MALEMKPSRFAALPDDVPDRVVSAKKEKGDQPKKKKTVDKKGKASTGNNSKGSSSNGNGNKKKTLKSMAFGETGRLTEVKKKPIVAKSNPIAAISASLSAPLISSGGGDQNYSQDVLPNSIRTSPRRSQPPGMTTAQWQEWQMRDSELVDGTYESELEAALIQSKLAFQTEESRRKTDGPVKSKAKKKPVAVPLNEFNATLDEPQQSVYKHPNHHQSSSRMNNGVNVNIRNGNPPTIDPDEELVERFRIEAKLEMEREKRLAVERDMLKNRQSQTHFGVLNKSVSSVAVEDVKLAERDATISTLTMENMELRNDLDSCKARLKKVFNILQEAQDLKDKAKLLYQVENLNKLNGDLNDNIKLLHSELEQERSKCHAALTEYRKLLEQTRKRTTTETSQ